MVNQLKFILRYFKYLIRSKSRHGIHSPFVFNLITEVFEKQGQNYFFDNINKIRHQLLKSDQKIRITDFGAGSQKSNARERKVSDIARVSAKPRKLGELLFRLAVHFKPNTVLEMGTSLGLSTLYLASANTNARVITMEGCPETLAIAKENFKSAGLTNIQTVEGNFDQTLSTTLDKMDRLDFLFLDGNHRKEPTLRYFNECYEKSDENTLFILDDIHWSQEMEDAWKEVKKDPRVTVTIDLFFIGLVFFRKGQAKQNFTIRYH